MLLKWLVKDDACGGDANNRCLANRSHGMSDGLPVIDAHKFLVDVLECVF